MHVTVEVAIFASMFSLVTSVQNDQVFADSAMEVISAEIISKIGNVECDLIVLPADAGQDCQICNYEFGTETLNIVQQVLYLIPVYIFQFFFLTNFSFNSNKIELSL